MIETFQSGGVMMWPMLVIALGVVILAGRAAARLWRADGSLEDVDRSLQSIVFWGLVALVLGVLGSVVGLVQMAQAIAAFAASGVTMATIWGGFAVALITTIFGLSILLVALIVWFVLRVWFASTRRIAGESSAA